MQFAVVSANPGRTLCPMRVTLKQRAYRHIREKLLAGEMAPGSVVSPLRLAREIGVSHTPVREAIGLLQSEGLLEDLGEAGIQVRTLSREDLREILDLRLMIEGTAAELAAKRATEDELSQIRDICDEYGRMAHRLREAGVHHYSGSTIDELDCLDLKLHLGVMRLARCARAMKISADLHLLEIAFRHGHGRDLKATSTLARVARIYRYHRCIARALERRDGEAARKWMCAHLCWAEQIHLALFDQQSMSLREQRESGLLRGLYPSSVSNALETVERNRKEQNRKKTRKCRRSP